MHTSSGFAGQVPEGQHLLRMTKLTRAQYLVIFQFPVLTHGRLQGGVKFRWHETDLPNLEGITPLLLTLP